MFSFKAKTPSKTPTRPATGDSDDDEDEVQATTPRRSSLSARFSLSSGTSPTKRASSASTVRGRARDGRARASRLGAGRQRPRAARLSFPRADRLAERGRGRGVRAFGSAVGARARELGRAAAHLSRAQVERCIRARAAGDPRVVSAKQHDRSGRRRVQSAVVAVAGPAAGHGGVQGAAPLLRRSNAVGGVVAFRAAVARAVRFRRAARGGRPSALGGRPRAVGARPVRFRTTSARAASTGRPARPSPPEPASPRRGPPPPVPPRPARPPAALPAQRARPSARSSSPAATTDAELSRARVRGRRRAPLSHAPAAVGATRARRVRHRAG